METIGVKKVTCNSILCNYLHSYINNSYLSCNNKMWDLRKFNTILYNDYNPLKLLFICFLVKWLSEICLKAFVET